MSTLSPSTNDLLGRDKITIQKDFVVPAEYAGDFGDLRSPLKFYDGREVKSPADWKKRRQEILDHWHGMMGQWPPLYKDQNLEIIRSEKRDNFIEHKIQFRWTPNDST